MVFLSCEELRRLPYLELKEYAKKQGLKKINVKAEKLISAILSANARADETLESLATCDGSLDSSLYVQSQVPHEVSNIGDLSSRRRSRRITRVFYVEKTPEEKKYSSEDSEIEINTPIPSVKKGAKTSSKTVDVTSSVEDKSWSEDSEIVLKTPSSILKRSSTFSVEVPVTPVEKQPKSSERDVDVLTSNQPSFRPKAALVKKMSIVPVKTPDIPDVQKKETIYEDQTYIISEHPLPVTPAKTPRKSILRHGKKAVPQRNGKSSGSKVNFITPDRRLLRRSVSETPLRSVKDRPKTPVAVKQSVKRKGVSSPFPERSPKYVKTINGQATPRSLNGETGVTIIKLDKGLQASTPLAKSAEQKQVAAGSKIHSANFKEIHKKAFDKMEDLEEYQKRLYNRMNTLTRSQKRSRKEVTYSVKESMQKNCFRKKISNSKTEPLSLKPSRIPQPFRGIPFIPGVKSVGKIDTNFTNQARSQSFVHSTSKRFVRNENENLNRRCQRNLFNPGSSSTVSQFDKDHFEENLSSVAAEKQSRKKFDLKASLAMKLPYKPYRGVLQPLSDSNAKLSQRNASYLDPIQKKREQSREILKGVRKNRRFELQMSRRGIS